MLARLIALLLAEYGAADVRREVEAQTRKPSDRRRPQRSATEVAKLAERIAPAPPTEVDRQRARRALRRSGVG